MTSFSHLQKVTIGHITQNQPIKLVDYDPSWPELFQLEREKITEAMDEKALQIEHVGSTAIPHLCAKPIIDMLLLVPDPSKESTYVPQLEKVGYVLRIREPASEGHRMFIGNKNQLHIHVYGPKSEEARDLVLFRDWLRINQADRLKYQALKEQLAQRSWQTVQDYADAEGPVITEIKQRAREHIADVWNQ
ncbi:GrpB family protein [Lactobacillus xylocopicola]|uniref:GrpB family protein n=1 Tax=Lactobacillus xylocopicola TaxID=2976676 RepID=A0ABM8BGF8_9LACO|nr:GrpB family protein [Lactobacillus xylocopicola]BDR60303.1 hypothetical protein KIM322_05640 [Lactobacillus xylocopicola]